MAKAGSRAGRKTSERGGRGGKGGRGGSDREAPPPGLLRARRLGLVVVALAFAAGIWAAGWLLELDRVVVSRFEGRRFSVPSRVYAAPIVIYPGADWQRLDLAGWLLRTGYREQKDDAPLAVGSYRWGPGRLRVHLRGFEHPQLPEDDRKVEFRLAGGRVAEMRDDRGGRVPVVTLEPEAISSFFGGEREQRDLIEIAEVPDHLIAAIYAVEDRRFEQHHGIDPRRIAGALLANLRAGGIRQGGSTLTQQLVKNFFLTPERTLRRKLTEAAMALLVEARYDKRQILEAYLNEIYMGRRGSTAIHGIGEAARFFYGKRVADLSIDESALLAAVIQSPNAMSPHRHPERAKKRRDLVLELMAEQGRITREEAEHARGRELSLAAISLESGQDRYFLDALAKQLPEVYDDELLSVEGLRIYSTLDTMLQRAAVKHLADGLASLEKRLGVDTKKKGAARLQGCLLVMRPQTGEILAMVGGRDYATSQWNRCTMARRQAGSVFKPVVYAAALAPQSGPAITLATMVPDEPLRIDTPNGAWEPVNFDKQFRGPVTAREALERSLNVPAARIGQRVGISNVVEMARRLGIESPLPAVPSLALGTAEVSPLEIATVYATFANGGLRPTPRSFIGLLDDRGVGQEQWPLAGARRVLDPGTAYLTTSLLEGVVDRGTGSGLRARGLRGPIAGKTGTTDEEYDLWFVGFTPEMVAVVWVGYDEPKAIGVPSSRGALPIWADFLSAVTGDEVRGAFVKPSSVEQIDIDPQSGARALLGCPEHRPEYFLAGTAPEKTCPRERFFRRRGFFDRLFGR
ncbi:MAG: PBP1A family penicillin-binding protein [Spirochaetaceae bacterium]|nr:PBP1A family penicillin-binding protein [Myxococcales bacterium]MCB9724018.1 PBP1A family penicillin-binding protein [Spirochaetaceae bacterium]